VERNQQLAQQIPTTPFKPNQHVSDEQVKEILYSIIPKCWQSYLQ
jgi:hypothetical protein